MTRIESDAWKAFQWVRNGENGGSREGYTPGIFKTMDAAERQSAEIILLQDFQKDIPFSEVGLAFLLGEKICTESKYKNLFTNNSVRISVYGALLLTTKNTKYVDLLVAMYPLQTLRDKITIASSLQRSLMFDNEKSAIHLIQEESNGEARRSLATALYRSIAKSHMDFKKPVIDIYSNIENSNSKPELEKLVKSLISIAQP